MIYARVTGTNRIVFRRTARSPWLCGTPVPERGAPTLELAVDLAFKAPCDSLLDAVAFGRYLELDDDSPPFSAIRAGIERKDAP